MKTQYLLIDGNSIGNRAQNTGEVLSIGGLQTQAIFHFLRTMRSYLAKHSMAKPVVLWDGMSWRKKAFPAYKEDRERENTPHEKKAAEMRKAYHAQKPHIQKALSLLGVTQVQASNMEADDLAAIMADLYVSRNCLVTLVSEDRDWLQLVQGGVAMERPITGDRITAMNFEEITGVKTPEQFVTVKALMGDKGDSVPGVGGIGKKRAVEIIENYGSFDRLIQMTSIDKTVDPASLPKYLRDLVENEEKALAFALNQSLVDLRHPSRPPVEGLAVNPGEPDIERFRQMCEILLFKTFTDDFDLWIEPFPVGRSRLLAAA